MFRGTKLCVRAVRAPHLAVSDVEVVERGAEVARRRRLFEAQQLAVVEQCEVARPPCLDVFT